MRRVCSRNKLHNLAAEDGPTSVQLLGLNFNNSFQTLRLHIQPRSFLAHYDSSLTRNTLPNKNDHPNTLAVWERWEN